MAAAPHRHSTPDPGTTSLTHFPENLAVANLSLTRDEVEAITALASED